MFTSGLNSTDQGRRDHDHDRDKRLQVKIALISGAFVVLAALIGGFFTLFNHGKNDDVSQPGRAPVTNSSAPPSLSAPAMALINRDGIPCQPSPSPVSNIGDITINSPLSGATVSRHGTVHGTAKLSGGDQLYFFVYAPGACEYYFQPAAPVSVEPDGSWQVQLYLDGNNPGDKVDLYAAVLGPDAHATLGEILHYFDVTHETSPYMFKLPSGTRAAHINIELSS